jgi:hypothetical protein
VRDDRRDPACRPVRAQLPTEPIAAGKEFLGEGDNLGRRAVVALEWEDLGVRDVGELGDRFGIRTTPTVDRLVWVADDHEVSVHRGEALGEPRLNRVDVVELVDEHRPKACGELLANTVVFGQESIREHDEVGVVDHCERSLARFVADRDSGDQL